MTNREQVENRINEIIANMRDIELNEIWNKYAIDG